jgi:hypothetical protein
MSDITVSGTHFVVSECQPRSYGTLESVCIHLNMKEPKIIVF